MRAQAEELVSRGVLLTRQGKLDQAYAAYELAFDTYPLAAALDGKGCVLLLKGAFAEAQEYFFMAGRQDPRYTIWRANLAILKEIQGDSLSAEDLYSTYMKEKPFDAKRKTNHAAFLHDNYPKLDTAVRSKTDALIELRKAVVMGGGTVAATNLETAQQQ